MEMKQEKPAVGADGLYILNHLHNIVPFPENQSGVITLKAFLTHSLPPRELILEPWLTNQSLNMIYSWRGVGKTHVALGIAYAVASGRRVPGVESREAKRCPVS